MKVSHFPPMEVYPFYIILLLIHARNRALNQESIYDKLVYQIRISSVSRTDLIIFEFPLYPIALRMAKTL